MKYPCGKEFNPGDISILRNAKHLKIVDMHHFKKSKNDSIAFQVVHLDTREHVLRTAMDCGHAYSDHEDSDMDLVNFSEENAKEKEETETVKLDLSQARQYLDCLSERINFSKKFPNRDYFNLPLEELAASVREIINELEKLK